jgi:hypothetical protein
MLPMLRRHRRHPHDLILGRFKWREVRLPASDRPKHCHIIGATGEGKSYLLLDLIAQTIRSGLGLGCIDPHSALITQVIQHLVSDGTLAQPDIRRRLIYIRPANDNYVVPFNVLNTPETTYTTASNVLEAFKRTWPQALVESPRFDEIVTASLVTLIENGLTLMQMRRFLTDKDFRDQCLSNVSDREVVDFFHQTYDTWGVREAAVYTQSTLNKVSAFTFNPTLKLMLGQRHNVLDFKAILDNGLILLLDLGHLPPLTRRLLGGLVMSGLEAAMRRRESDTLWSLFVDEFAQFVANDGSAEAFADILSEARKFMIALFVAHQTTDQLPETIKGGLKNAYTKIVHSVDWEDAELLAKTMGRVQKQAVKQEAKTDTQLSQMQPYAEQWLDVAESLRSQPERWAHVATRKRPGQPFRTRTIPKATADPSQVEAVWTESMSIYGLPLAEAKRNIEVQTDPQPGLSEVQGYTER